MYCINKPIAATMCRRIAYAAALFGVLASAAYADPVISGPQARSQKDRPSGYAGLNASSQITALSATAGLFWGNGGNNSWYGQAVNPAAPCPVPTEVDSNVHCAQNSQITLTDSTIARQAAELTNCDFAAHNSAEAVCKFFAATAESGAPNAWVIAAELVTKPGATSGAVAELDAVNENHDCGDLTVGLSCLDLTVGVGLDGIGNGRSGTYANTVAALVQGSGTGILWHTGFLAYGTGVIDGEAFAEVTDAYNAFKIAGSHVDGIDFFFGSYSDAAIRLNNLQKIVFDPLRGVPSIYADTGTLMLAAPTEVTQNLTLDGALFASGSNTLSLGDATHGASLLVLDPGGAVDGFLEYIAATAGNFGTNSDVVTLTALSNAGNAVSIALNPHGAGQIVLNGPTEITGNETVSGNVIAAALFSAGSTPLFLGNATRGGFFELSDPGGAVDAFAEYAAATAGNFGGGDIVNLTMATNTPGRAVSLGLNPANGGEIILNGTVALPSGASFTIPSLPTGTAVNHVCQDSAGKFISCT